MDVQPISFPGEEWRRVTDERCGEEIEVSSLGRVRRLPRTYTRKGRPGVAPYLTTRPLRLAPIYRRFGYPYVNARWNGRWQGVAVHILVCGAFHGPRPSEEHEVAHNDGVRTNIAPGNLRWATPLENEHDKIEHGTLIRGEEQHLAKLNDDAVREMRRRWRAGCVTPKELATRLNVAPCTIRRALAGKTWKHVS